VSAVRSAAQRTQLRDLLRLALLQAARIVGSVEVD
jgi:hypothetical protein